MSILSTGLAAIAFFTGVAVFVAFVMAMSGLSRDPRDRDDRTA